MTESLLADAVLGCKPGYYTTIFVLRTKEIFFTHNINILN